LSYIPEKINDKTTAIDNRIPTDFNERFGKMEANLQNMQDRLNRLTPASLNDLIPSANTGISPAMLTTRLRKASGVIDVALTTHMAAAPDSLTPLMLRLRDIRSRYKGNPQVLAAANSTDVRLSAYENASKEILKGIPPITNPSEVPKSTSGRARGIMNLNMTCEYPTAHFLGVPQESATVNEYIFNVHVKTCAQKLDGPRWIKTDFNGSVIEYEGGPLYLADVSFTNCTFKFGSDPKSRAALSAIEAGKGNPVSLLILE
jgi:hypothetical protein